MQAFKSYSQPSSFQLRNTNPNINTNTNTNTNTNNSSHDPLKSRIASRTVKTYERKATLKE